MAINLPVYKQRRLVLVRFRRATTGDPDPARPDVDDRGWTGDFGPSVGLVSGEKITVRLRRERISTAAKLYASSTDASSVVVSSPATFELPATPEMDIELTGGLGGNPRKVRLEIRYGSVTGPVIHALNVWVYTKLTVKLTPHMVNIADTTHAGVPSAVNVATIMDKVKAIWKASGVDFSVQATVNDAHTFAHAGVFQATVANAAGTEVWSPEIATLLSSSYVPSTINAYFVRQINLVSSSGVLGLGLSRATIGASAGTLPQPGIILGDNNASGVARAGDPMWLANDLAHEIGHFFQLWHPEQKQPPHERKDTWSRRMLMHNLNSMDKLGGWKDTVIGYGNNSDGYPARGCLLTMKHLSQLTTDGEAVTARGTISSAAGPY